ncbi:hypothetical protein X741_23850 [Mesorhizobium sp. LNHC229A00]|nr:hypothetical protein X741_23850 [Mesorhizobium sp. LNHC229A00]
MINDHRKAWAHWQSVCACTDSAILGREATAQEHQTWEDGSDGEYSALYHVCRFPARTPPDLAAKGRYLRKFHPWRYGELDNQLAGLAAFDDRHRERRYKMTAADNYKTRFSALEPLICDADNTMDVLMDMLERHFAGGRRQRCPYRPRGQTPVFCRLHGN